MSRTATFAAKQTIQKTGGITDASMMTHTEATYAVVNVADDSTTVYTGPCLLLGVYVNTALSAHVCPIKDGSTTVVSIAASAAAGTSILYPGIRFETSLVVDPDNSGTGSITVAYRPI